MKTYDIVIIGGGPARIVGSCCSTKEWNRK